MNADKLHQLKSAIATASAMLQVANELLEQEDRDGAVPSLSGVDHMGDDAGRREDPDRRQGDTSRGGEPVALRGVAGGRFAEAGAGGADVAGRGAGGPPRGLPTAARHLADRARYRVIDGGHAGKEGVLVPGRITESGFGKIHAELALPSGEMIRCRAEDLLRLDG